MRSILGGAAVYRCDKWLVLSAGRFGSPGGRVKMFDKNLVHAIIGGKDLYCGSAELRVNLVLTRGHGSLLPDL